MRTGCEVDDVLFKCGRLTDAIYVLRLHDVKYLTIDTIGASERAS